MHDDPPSTNKRYNPHRSFVGHHYRLHIGRLLIQAAAAASSHLQTTMAGTTRIMAAVILMCCCSSLFISAYAQKTTLMFAFGDSYADTGNSQKSGMNVASAWKFPYGITWPGQPAGRYSDGKIQTDWFADMLGLPYLPAYFYSAGQNTSSGVNFAVAGSGVTYTSGVQNTPLAGQVDNFELFLRTDPYSKVALANSVTLVSVSGNDYLAFTGTTSAELFKYIELVVSGLQTSLQRLYDLGLRNVMVTNLPPVGCYPILTAKTNYRVCDSSYDAIVTMHNAFLLGAVQSINALNPGARFIILDQAAAFGHLFKQTSAVGFTDKLVPCCKGTTNTSSCGDVDANGKWLYTVCKKRGRAVFWDKFHPTMWAWHYVIQLYTDHPQFILLADAPTLKQWLQINDAVQEPVAAPMAQPDMSLAIGQVQAALNFLLGNPKYSEALGLLQSFDLEIILGQYPQTVVTVFLPTNDAFTATDTTLIDNIFSQNKVEAVGLYHTVSNYYDANTLLTQKPASLTTVSNEQLPVAYSSQGIFIGANSAAKVVDPDLYTVPGKVVIHGIDHVVIPPGL